MPPAMSDHLRSIKTFPSLVKYLRDELDWPIETENFDDLTFEYEANELGLDEKTAVKIKEIKQLRPMVTNQPWGIFFINFEPKRLPVVVLRRILSSLVIKKRQSAHRAQQPTWQLHDLLFISSYGESEHRDITFAHFAEDKDWGDLPTLKVLGWDDEDTVLHIDHAERMLQEKLHWPENTKNIELWRLTWSDAFTLRHREVVTTSKALSELLAHLAIIIRKRVNLVLKVESETGPMRKLMNTFKETLIHDLNEDDFADMYAQTITYGLLTARVSRPSGLVADNVTDMVPITNPFLRDLLSTFLTVGGRKKEIDFDELGINDVVQLLRDVNMEAVLRDFGDLNPMEDPVIHFYELFLKEYDPEKRTKRGVFYTPRPVVSFIVRSVDDLLRTEFGLEDGLADITTWGEMKQRYPDLQIPKGTNPEEPFVQILDIATGTGTFWVEVIDVIYKTMTQKWKKQGYMELQFQQLWNEYVPKHLLPRMYGFELMMAPYAVAHMKIGLKLYETGYRFGSDERARIYLTNTLEPPQDFSDQFEIMAPALAHEAKAANEVKRNKHLTVIIGNPPYSGHSYNLTPFARSLIEPYKFISGERIKEKGALQLEKNLNDDYVKFMRMSQVLSVGCNCIIGMITNHSFLENPTLRGMRWSLLQDFNSLYFLDLHGNTARNERAKDGSKDENVFDISQGVAISLLTRKPCNDRQSINRYDLLGSRISKYALLHKYTVKTAAFIKVEPKPTLFLFRKEDTDIQNEYTSAISVTDIFPLNSTGVKTHRDTFCIDFDLGQLEKRIEHLCEPSVPSETIRIHYGLKDTYGWKLERCRQKLRTNPEWRNAFSTILYRPFDWRHIYFSSDVVELARMEVSRHFIDHSNLGFVFMRQVASGEGYNHFCVTRNPVDNRAFYSNRGTMSFAPLYLYSSRKLLENDTDGISNLNLSPLAISNFENGLRLKFRISRSFDSESFSPEELFHYIYAFVHSLTYRKRYENFLKVDFPKVMVPVKIDLFRILNIYGADLVALHLLEDDYPAASWNISKPRGKSPLKHLITKFQTMGIADVAKGYPRYANKKVYISETSYFEGVPEPVWNFYMGSYQVCEKWLKDRRGRVLSEEDILHYQRIIVALNETTRLMAEIDKVIDAHGGWPNAFVTTKEI